MELRAAGVNMTRLIQDYLIWIIEQYEIWEPLAKFLGLDPEDGIETIFSNTVKVLFESHSECELEVTAVDRENRELGYSVMLHPRMNSDRLFLQSFTVDIRTREEDLTISTETFLLQATPVLEESVVAYMETSVFVNGLSLYDTYNHILRKDADVPSVISLLKSDIPEAPSKPEKKSEKKNSPSEGSFTNKDSKKEFRYEFTRDHFPTAVVYEMLKDTVTRLRLRSPIFDGLTIFGIPSDTRLERARLWDNSINRLTYRVSGAIYDVADDTSKVSISAQWILLYDTDGCGPYLFPSSITMIDDASSTTINCHVGDAGLNPNEFNVTTVRSYPDQTDTSKSIIEIPPIVYNDYVNLYDIYDSEESEDYNRDTYLMIGNTLAGKIRGNQMQLAHLITRFHSDGMKRLSYSWSDMKCFLALLEIDLEIADRIVDLFFDIHIGSDGKYSTVILNPVDEKIKAVVKCLKK